MLKGWVGINLVNLMDEIWNIKNIKCGENTHLHHLRVRYDFIERLQEISVIYICMIY